MIADRVIFVCIIVLAAVYFFATAQIPSLDIGDPLGPKAFPRLLGFCLLGTAALLLIEMIKNRTRARAEATQSESAVKESRQHLVVIGAVVVWTGLYYAAFEWLGYLLATTIYLIALMAYFHRGRWLTNVVTSALFSICSYVLFVKVLTVNLAKGILYF